MNAPSARTLAKYGLTADEWLTIVERQGGVCPICQEAPKTGRWVTDHVHAKGYKSFPPEKKKAYVRGITCTNCNRFFLGRGLTIARAENIVQYLKEFNERISSIR